MPRYGLPIPVTARSTDVPAIPQFAPNFFAKWSWWPKFDTSIFQATDQHGISNSIPTIINQTPVVPLRLVPIPPFDISSQTDESLMRGY
jgi:hypothetical protein